MYVNLIYTKEVTFQILLCKTKEVNAVNELK